MSPLVLVDTSAWTQALRKSGDAAVRARVQQLLIDQTAAWCDIVRLELWSGVRNDQERAGLQLLEASLPRLPIDDNVWNVAVDCASKARRAGLTTPANDLLIFACARRHSCRIEHNDHHFDLLAKLP
jgi:predicted nucleic acid-binding protein